MGNVYSRSCTHGIRNYGIAGRGEPSANGRPPARIPSTQQSKSRELALG